MDALVILSQATGLSVWLLDRDGGVLYPDDRHRFDAQNLKDVSWLSRRLKDGISGYARVLTSPGGRRFFTAALGSYYLAVAVERRGQDTETMKKVFLEALPLIARVAGGEAALFDREGILLASRGPDGKEIRRAGSYTPQGRKSMVEGRPFLGTAVIEEGALAVRIPVCSEFGVGFNNYLAAKHKRSLFRARENATRYTFDDIIGEGKSISKVKASARRVASSDSTILIFGETGTGKELFAQAIHSASGRRDGPFVALNCSALPPNLTESLLFGYVGGAFTGARKEGQEGLFEQASGGTLFLDDISEMDLSIQPRFLRAVQESEVVRVGGKSPIHVDVRIIASTNRDLWEMVGQGQFRKDLFYRLNVIDLHLPRLKDRTCDIAPICEYLVAKLNGKLGTSVKGISPDAFDRLRNYEWPGNVRELHNVLERILNLTVHEVIQPDDLPEEIREASSASRSSSALTLRGRSLASERESVVIALKEEGYSRIRTAKRLGISTATLWRKMKRLGIEDP